MLLGFGVIKARFSGLGSEQRGNRIAQSHLLYSRWQSSHPTKGEYMSDPQAKVDSEMVKLVSVPMV